MYPITAYFLVGTALVLLLLGYSFKRFVLVIFSGVLFMFTGFSFLNTNVVTSIGEYSVTNSSLVNVTITNSSLVYTNTTGISQYPYGIVFILLGFFLLFDGAYKIAKFEEA